MCRALADCFTFPIQSKVEEWKATIKMIDREHSRLGIVIILLFISENNNLYRFNSNFHGIFIQFSYNFVVLTLENKEST